LLVDDALLHGVQGAVRGGQPFDGLDLPAAHCVGEHGTGIMRDIIDQHGAGAALGAVAAEFGAGEAQFIAQGRGQRFLLHDVHAALLAVNVQRDQTLDRAWPGSRRLSVHGGGSEQVRCRGHSAPGDHAFDQIASG
jgi:hypothetical protein